MLKKIISAIFLLSLIWVLSACSKQESPDTIKVGTVEGPEVQLLEAAQQEALKRYGLHVKIVAFSDYNTPNAALNDGTIDADVFQHLPFLQSQIKARGYRIIPIAKTFIFPMGIYSKKIAQLSQLPNNVKVAVPNDPSNEARALLLLQKAKLITLKPGVNTNATPIDVVQNPKNLKIIELDAAELPRVLNDVSLAVINTNYAVPAGLRPTKDALFLEDKNSYYVNIIAIREKDKENPKILQFIQAFHSQPVIEKANQLFGNDAIPAWLPSTK